MCSYTVNSIRSGIAQTLKLAAGKTRDDREELKTFTLAIIIISDMRICQMSYFFIRQIDHFTAILYKICKNDYNNNVVIVNLCYTNHEIYKKMLPINSNFSPGVPIL